jgi:protein-disulfide isomerase
LPFHSEAMSAAELSIEAFEEGGPAKFWAMHDRLFDGQEDLGRPSLERAAQALGLRMARVRRALDAHLHRARVDVDLALARDLDTAGTPTFFVNGRKIRGAVPPDVLGRLVESERTAALARVARGTPRRELYEEIIREASTAVSR